MASTGVEPRASEKAGEKYRFDSTPIARGVEDEEFAASGSLRYLDGLKPVYDSTHRKLKPRHIQLIGIGGLVPSTLVIANEKATKAAILKY